MPEGFGERQRWRARERVRVAILTLREQGQPITISNVRHAASVANQTAYKYGAELGVKFETGRRGKSSKC
jgi:hypothetical protein